MYELYEMLINDRRVPEWAKMHLRATASVKRDEKGIVARDHGQKKRYIRARGGEGEWALQTEHFLVGEGRKYCPRSSTRSLARSLVHVPFCRIDELCPRVKQWEADGDLCSGVKRGAKRARFREGRARQEATISRPEAIILADTCRDVPVPIISALITRTWRDQANKSIIASRRIIFLRFSWH